MIRVGGLAALSTTDYPGRLAAVVFVQGCPWRCRYCHNPHLQPRATRPGTIGWPHVRELLHRRRGLLDAVVFSGGEPTVDPGLPAAIAEVRSLGYLVGLHTAGTYPRRLAAVLPLLDWVGFDVKGPASAYAATTGRATSARAAHASLELLLASGVDHEVRTTWHPELLPVPDLLELVGDLRARGARRFALQEYREQGSEDRRLEAFPVSAELEREVEHRWPRFTLRRSGSG